MLAETGEFFNRLLGEVAAFLRSLPEEQWCHFGEI